MTEPTPTTLLHQLTATREADQNTRLDRVAPWVLVGLFLLAPWVLIGPDVWGAL